MSGRFRFLRRVDMSAPVYMLLGLACVAIASYVLASFMIRPNGDDYVWLYTFHERANWIHSTLSFMKHDNGRFAQNLSVSIPYHFGGTRFLLLTGIISIATFVASAYLVLRGLQKIAKVSLPRRATVAGASLFVLAYTALSLTYVEVLGLMDNTFQDFMWYAGFITYTFPVLLLASLSAVVVLYRDKLTPARLVGLYLVSVWAGLYGETTSLLYAGALCVMSAAWLVRSRMVRSYFAKAKPFLLIAAGTCTGLLVTYLSPGSIERRKRIHDSDTMRDIIAASFKGTNHFLTHHLIPSRTMLFLALCIGASVGLYLVSRKYLSAQRLLKLSAFAAILAFCVGLVSLFIAFVSIYKGYGIGGYIVPRFEIFYNIWFVSAWICGGAALGSLGLLLLRRKISQQAALSACALVLCVGITVVAPNMASKASARVKKMAVHSQQWDDLNADIEKQVGEGKQNLLLPTIDIGDGYRMPCNTDPLTNWLGTTKSHYYGVKSICTPGGM